MEFLTLLQDWQILLFYLGLNVLVLLYLSISFIYFHNLLTINHILDDQMVLELGSRKSPSIKDKRLFHLFCLISLLPVSMLLNQVIIFKTFYNFLVRISKYPNLFFYQAGMLISNVFAVILSNALRFTIVSVVFFFLFDLIVLSSSLCISILSDSSSNVG